MRWFRKKEENPWFDIRFILSRAYTYGHPHVKYIEASREYTAISGLFEFKVDASRSIKYMESISLLSDSIIPLVDRGRWSTQVNELTEIERKALEIQIYEELQNFERYSDDRLKRDRQAWRTRLDADVKTLRSFISSVSTK